jgi:hypothetical protein
MGIWLWDEDQENGSENSFYQDMKLKVYVRGWRGRYQSPLSAPALKVVTTYYLFGGYHILGKYKAAGVKNPYAFRFFLNRCEKYI